MRSLPPDRGVGIDETVEVPALLVKWVMLTQ